MNIMINYKEIVSDAFEETKTALLGFMTSRDFATNSDEIKKVLLKEMKNEVGKVLYDYYTRYCKIYQKSDLINPIIFYAQCLNAVETELYLDKRREKNEDLATDEFERVYHEYSQKMLKYLIEQETKKNEKSETNDNNKLPEISNDILDRLAENKLIDRQTLEWTGAKNLCAYFVDNYFDYRENDRWAIGTQIFGVKNLAQLKYNYEQTSISKPKEHKKIDEILNIK